MKTAVELRQDILDKADVDEAFRARLLADPKTAISDELGIDLPDEFSMSVHEDTMSHTHLVLPPTSRLTDEQASHVVGGSGYLKMPWE